MVNHLVAELVLCLVCLFYCFFFVVVVSFENQIKNKRQSKHPLCYDHTNNIQNHHPNTTKKTNTNTKAVVFTMTTNQNIVNYGIYFMVYCTNKVKGMK